MIFCHNKVMGIIAPQYQNEDAAREHLEATLWPNGPFCPHCGVIENIYKLESKADSKTKLRKGVYKCGGCRKPFTVTVGTIFEDSHIPLHKWLLGFHLMCSSKKGMSALQFQRELWGENPDRRDKHGRPRINGSYRTAWFMCHRIRWAMTQSPMAELFEKKMSGVVEVDETYVGGYQKGHQGRPNVENSNKTPVLALLERGGNVRSFPLERTTLKNIKPILRKHIDPSTHVVTDESAIYYMMKPEFAKHSTVNHRAKEYARREENFNVTTNTVESFFALLKRANYGTHHHMSRKYLGSYCAERDFVYNGRKLTDDQRTEKAIKAARGKRLMLNGPKGA
jgi:transposase-like protein